MMDTRHADRISFANLGTTLLLHALVFALWLTFSCMRLVNPRFRRAIGSLDTTYQFRSGCAVRQLIISSGRVRTHAGAASTPDYEIAFLDLAGVLRHLRVDSNDVVGLLMENKIEQTGNEYHLFNLGYLIGLCRRFVSDLPHALRLKRQLATSGRGE